MRRTFKVGDGNPTHAADATGSLFDRSRSFLSIMMMVSIEKIFETRARPAL
ncbi:hypothetical protein [Aliidongia dinghuensis]|uniref:hypothetical protein n=1 Tax=Aliidongia dinghuensis TaxID=1867774 RepID=UPI0016665AD5|nr:hypothetical protein [Aliidongia dinghuensis]